MNALASVAYLGLGFTATWAALNALASRHLNRRERDYLQAQRLRQAQEAAR